MIYESPPRGGEKLKEHDSEVQKILPGFPLHMEGENQVPLDKECGLITAMRREFSELYKSLT